MTAKRTTKKAPAKAEASDSEREAWGRMVRPTVFVPQYRVNAELELENAITRRPIHGSLFARLPDVRFDELVTSARRWLDQAKAVEPDAQADERYAIDAYKLAVTEARKAIDVMRVEALAQAGFRLSESGKRGGAMRRPPTWHADAVKHAQTLLATGRETHELAGLCARKFRKSDDAVRRVLQKAGVVPAK